MSDKKVAVIGLDGMAWHVLNTLFKHGAMPYLEGLVKKAASGSLISTIPPITAPAWTSIASGVNPGKHGAFDFIILEDEFKSRLINARDVMYPRIHEMLAMHGLASVVVNLPLTYPIRPMKNVMLISDLISDKIPCYPNTLERYARNYPRYGKLIEALMHGKILGEKNRAMTALDIFSKDCHQRTETVIDMIRNLDWNLFWVVFTEPDALLHHAYDSVFEGHPKVIRVFNQLDAVVKEAFQTSDLTLIVSDHGFSMYSYAVNVNTILHESGLAKATHNEASVSSSAIRLEHLIKEKGFSKKKSPLSVNIPSPFLRIASWRPLGKLVRKIYYRMGMNRSVNITLPQPDPLKSKAFMLTRSSMGVFLRDKSIREKVVNILTSIKGVAWAKKRDEVYWGPWVKRAADILVYPKFDEGYDIGFSKIGFGRILNWRSSDHHPLGIAVFAGGEVVPKEFTCSAMDITPTILAYFGLPLPEDTDGKPIPILNYPRVPMKKTHYLSRWKIMLKVSKVKKKIMLKRTRLKLDENSEILT